HGVREPGGISLSGCHPNRVQATEQVGNRGELPIPLLGPRTSFGNNVRRAGNSSRPRSNCRSELQLGPAPDTAHSFFARYESPAALGGQHWMTTVLSGQHMPLPV